MKRPFAAFRISSAPPAASPPARPPLEQLFAFTLAALDASGKLAMR
jgi:hypothetical protein